MVAKTNYYHQQIIDIVSNPNTNWKLLVIEIAKINPEIVVNTFNDTQPGSWENALRNDPTMGKVAAIKLCRALTGWGLKDAKHAVESFCDKYNLNVTY